MARCNAHYYATRDPLGREGDFITAPEISQVFGEILGAWLAESWKQAGSPHAVLLELGPGRGTLMRDALRATSHVPGFHAHVSVVLLETSPALQAKQAETLGPAHPHVSWIETLAALPPKPVFFVANEFFDALPIRQFVGDVERCVEAGRFVPEGAVTEERCAAAADVMRALATHVALYGGAGLVVDYGYSGTGTVDTLQAVRKHVYVNPLAHPGEQDLTAHVSFDALEQAATSAGAAVQGPVPQGEFLRRLGAELRASMLARRNPAQAEAILSGLARLMSPTEMGVLFQVLAVRNNALLAGEGFA